MTNAWAETVDAKPVYRGPFQLMRYMIIVIYNNNYIIYYFYIYVVDSRFTSASAGTRYNSSNSTDWIVRLLRERHA
jgi:hypothetical protein